MTAVDWTSVSTVPREVGTSKTVATRRPVAQPGKAMGPEKLTQEKSKWENPWCSRSLAKFLVMNSSWKTCC